MMNETAEKFLLGFAGWDIAEFSPAPGSTIGDSATYACAAIVLGASTVVFRFNGVRVAVNRNDTPVEVVARYNKALSAGDGE